MIPWRPEPNQHDMRYLRRTQRFLTDRPRCELERLAEACFSALGYRRREDEGGRLVFARGRRLASLYSPYLRSCLARVTIAADGDVVRVRHKVEVFGRLLVRADTEVIDAEVTCFRAFLQDDPVRWDLSPLLSARRRALRRRLVRLALLAAWTGFVAWAAVMVAAR